MRCNDLLMLVSKPISVGIMSVKRLSATLKDTKKTSRTYEISFVIR
jgi:hypothetical protein